jgi:hypothetical protein
VSADDQREIRMAMNLARLHADEMELAARQAVDHPTLDALTRVEDARSLMDESLDRVRRLVASAYERVKLGA